MTQCPAVQCTPRTPRESGAVGEDTGTPQDAGLQCRFGLAGLLVVQLVPHQPGFGSGFATVVVGGGVLPESENLAAQLPVLVGEPGRDLGERVVVVLVGEEGTVDTAADIGVRRVDAVAGVGAEPATVGGGQPGEIRLDDVLRISGVDEFKPFAGVPVGKLPAGTDRQVGGGPVGETGGGNLFRGSHLSTVTPGWSAANSAASPVLPVPHDTRGQGRNRYSGRRAIRRPGCGK